MRKTTEQSVVFLYICDTMGSLKKVEWTERKIQDKLKAYFFSPNSKKYEITNLYVYGWESDYLAITKSMIAHEVEIKISRSDFKNDTKNKIDKHLLLEGGERLGKFTENLPNYFYYAVPDGLISVDEVPDYAGLIYVTPWDCRVVKEAKKLTNKKFDPVEMNLTDKFYYNMYSWKAKYEALLDSASAEDLKRYKKMEKSYADDVKMYEKLLEEKDGQIDVLETELNKLKDEK